MPRAMMTVLYRASAAPWAFVPYLPCRRSFFFGSTCKLTTLQRQMGRRLTSGCEPPSFSYGTGQSLGFLFTSTVVGHRVFVLSSGWLASYSGSVGGACINNYSFFFAPAAHISGCAVSKCRNTHCLQSRILKKPERTMVPTKFSACKVRNCENRVPCACGSHPTKFQALEKNYFDQQNFLPQIRTPNPRIGPGSGEQRLCWGLQRGKKTLLSLTLVCLCAVT